MTKLIRYSIVLGLAALLLSACGQPAVTGEPSTLAAVSASAAPAVTPTAAASAAPEPTAAPAPSPAGDSAPAPTLAVIATVEPTATPALPTPTLSAGSGAGAGSAADTAMNFRKTLAGDIDGKYPIEMALSRTGDQLTGSYFYTAQQDGAAEPLSLLLDGTVDQDGRIQLAEYDAEQQTGAFDGRLEQATDGGVPVLRIVGTWTKPGGQPLPFSLTEQLVRIGDGGAYLSDTLTHVEDAERKVTYDAITPQIVGGDDLGFNQVAQEMVAHELDAFRAAIGQYLQEVPQPSDSLGSSIDVGYEVVTAAPRVISLLFNESTYSAGAAHPNHVSFVLNYDLTTGRTIELAELFTPGSDYLGVLSRYAIAEISTRDLSPFLEGAAPTPENYKSWNMQPDGLRITFDPYQVAAYAAGPQTVFVPYSELGDIIRPDGPLGAFIQ